MAEFTTADSFIVRVYRVDTEDHLKISGLVETMDGSGERVPFTGVDDLAAILNHSVRRPRKRERK